MEGVFLSGLHSAVIIFLTLLFYCCLVCCGSLCHLLSHTDRKWSTGTLLFLPDTQEKTNMRTVTRTWVCEEWTIRHDGNLFMVSPLPERWSAPRPRPPLNPRRTGSSTRGLWEVWSSRQHQTPKPADRHEGSSSDSRVHLLLVAWR